MASKRSYSGAVSKEVLLIAGGVLFVGATVALGLFIRSEPEPTAPAPIAVSEPEPSPVKRPVPKPRVASQTPQSPQPESGAPQLSPFAEMLEQYQAHVAELDREAYAYRNSIPVFAHYKEAFRTHVLPLMVTGERAHQQLAAQQADALSAQDDEAWQAQHAPYANAILAPYLAGVGEEVYQLATSGKTPVSPQDAENLGHWVASLQQAAGPEGDSWRGNPYESGTIEYLRFEAYLGESAGLFAAAMAQVLLPVPPELQARQDDLEAERQDLIDAAPPDQVPGLPEQYVEPFTRELAAAFGQFTQTQQPQPPPEDLPQAEEEF